MSVIHDALKTAQREKQSREAGVRPGGNPLIMPLRGNQPESEFSWKNTITIAVASVVIVGASWSLWVRMRNLNPRPPQSVPVATVPVEAVPPEVSPPARREPAAVREDPPVVATDAPAVSAPRQSTRSQLAIRRPAGTPERVASPPTAAAASSAARPADAPDVAPMREPVQSGRLRIAVEQGREGEAARLFAAGVAAHRAGDLPAARSAYERVLALQPNDVDALNNMGVLLAASRELDRAEALLRRAVRVAPRHVGAWNNLGTVLAQRGQPADAIAAFEQALSLDPQHQGARVSLAQQHLAIGATQKARQVLEEVLATNPAMPEAYYTMGQAYEMERDWAGAVRAYTSFMRVAPARLSADVDRVNQRVQMLSARIR